MTGARSDNIGECRVCGEAGAIRWGLCLQCRSVADKQWAASNSEPVSQFDTPSFDGLTGWTGSVVHSDMADIEGIE